MENIGVLLKALHMIEESCQGVEEQARVVKGCLANVQWKRRLALAALRETLRGILGSEVIDVFEHCVVLDESAQLKELARLAMGEERIVVPLAKPGLLVLEVRRVDGVLVYRARRTSTGKGILFKESARTFVSRVEHFLGQEIPFEEG